MTSKYTLEEQKEHRHLWMKALRSGDYSQGKDVLCRERNGTFEYCCLGVACEISGLGKFVPIPGLSNPLNVFNFVIKEELSQYATLPGEYATLPEEVQDWLGLRSHCGWYDNGGIQSLTKLNDKGISFTTIADIIESEPKELISSSKE